MFSAIIFVSGVGRLIFPYVVGPLAAASSFRVAIGLAAFLAFVVSLLTLYLHGVAKEGWGGVAETAA